MEVLHPERFVELGGQKVMVREYGNVEWLRLLPVAEPMVAAIADMLAGPNEPTYEVVLNAIATHTDAMLPLIVQAADRDMAWLESLHPNEVESLLMVWWSVNAHFFVMRARNRQAVEMASAARKASTAQALAGQKSTHASSPTAISAVTSAATPSDS